MTTLVEEIKQIIEKKGKAGWLRTEECAKEYSRDPLTKQPDDSRRRKFYRIRKQIEKGKEKGLQIQLLPGNISYTGLSSADPKIIEEFIFDNKKASLNVKTGLGFFAWLETRAERKQLERDKRINLLARKGAAAEEQCELDEDDDIVKKENEIDRKRGLL